MYVDYVLYVYYFFYTSRYETTFIATRGRYDKKIYSSITNYIEIEGVKTGGVHCVVKPLDASRLNEPLRG